MPRSTDTTYCDDSALSGPGTAGSAVICTAEIPETASKALNDTRAELLADNDLATPTLWACAFEVDAADTELTSGGDKSRTMSSVKFTTCCSSALAHPPSLFGHRDSNLTYTVDDSSPDPPDGSDHLIDEAIGTCCASENDPSLLSTAVVVPSGQTSPRVTSALSVNRAP